MVALMSFLLAQTSAKEITFKGAGGFELKGTLVLPAASKPVAGLVLLPGSGPTDRDENVPQMGLKTDLLKQIAERLATEGVATLRFDKRAVAAYRDKWPTGLKEINEFFGWDKFVGDAKAAYDYLRSQPGIDAKNVGLLGHSEGALIALQIGSNLEGTPSRPSTLLLLDGNGRPIDVVLKDQLQAKLPAQFGADKAKTLLDFADKAIDQIKNQGTAPTDPPQELLALFNPASISILHSYFNIDPLTFARAYSGDVLVINGELDNQVSAEKDAKLLYQTLQARKTGKSQLVIVPGAGHGLKKTPSLEANIYTGPILPEAMDAISSWMKARSS